MIPLWCINALRRHIMVRAHHRVKLNESPDARLKWRPLDFSRSNRNYTCQAHRGFTLRGETQVGANQIWGECRAISVLTALVDEGLLARARGRTHPTLPLDAASELLKFAN